MKLLVTGGMGFIGSNFVRNYLKEHPQDEVVNLDKLTYCGNPANLKDLEKNPNYSFVKGDICDKKAVQNALKGCQRVVHFAAESHVDRSVTGPEVFTQTNVLGTHVLLEYAREAGVERVLHISTDEVYGSISEGFFKESDAFNPSSPYSASKAAGDLLAQSYFKTFGFPVLIVRPSNNFGPYQFPEKLVPLFSTNLLEGKKVPLYAEGKNMRDWLYVEDNCSAIDFVLRNGKPGEAYNIAGGNEKTNIEITKILLRETGRDESFIEHVADRPGHDWRYAIDDSKLRTLGWKPAHSFEQAMHLTVEWYKKNSAWWKPLKEKKSHLALEETKKSGWKTKK